MMILSKRIHARLSGITPKISIPGEVLLIQIQAFSRAGISRVNFEGVDQMSYTAGLGYYV